MKQLQLILALVAIALWSKSLHAQPGGNKNGYSRGGSETTSKEMNKLFVESFLFTKGTLNIAGNDGENKVMVVQAIQESDKVILEFSKKVSEFVNAKPASNILKSNFHYVTSKANGLKNVISKAEDGIKNWRSLSAVSFLQDLHLYKAYIEGAIIVYPESISLQEQFDAANEAIKKIGSRENYLAKLESNQKSYINSLRIKPAEFRDATIEKMVKAKYEKLESKDNITVTHVNIVTNWIIEKNVLDIPINKEVEVNMAIKKGDGTCGFATGRVVSEYEGGGKYGLHYLTMTSPVIVAPCENMPK